MTILRAVAAELAGMFWTDRWLAGATLGLVGVVAGVALRLPGQPLVTGGLLLVGCVVILIGVVRRGARQAVRR
ncbi:MAG: hypothetical protein JO001_26630 [Alphaproteobacteria bacterium]|nr:hypothetical protein [Alphaproteobacteria bacterium]